MSAPRTETAAGLRPGAVSAGHIVFMVVAAAAPIAAVVGAMPLGIALGNGPGYVGAYVIASLVLLLFAVAYAAMSRHVTNAGAFYTYVVEGLGRRAGASAAFVALTAYNAVAIALSASFGFFAHTTVDSLFSVDLPWQAW
jgi:amino acid transporter